MCIRDRLNNCLALAAGGSFEAKAALMTVILAGVMFGSKPVLKKKVSPIMLIVISAVLGVIVYGI